MLGRADNWVARGAIAGVGFLPIAALALALGNWASLQDAALWVVIPVWLAIGVVAASRPPWGRILATAVLAGMAATLCYDAARLAMTWSAGMTDGIPNIGRLLLNDMDAPTRDVLGLAYAYRYLGDGGGLALAYAMGRRYSARSGMAFGACVCLCLWATLVLFPQAQALLFPLTPYALVMTMVGHLIYGATLGTLLARWMPAAEDAGEATDDRPTLTLTVTEAAAPPALREAEATLL